MASKKLPSWQFYPGDWMKDTDLRSVSSGARGLWIDMLCLMHESGRRGYLQVNGRPASLEQIARMTGNSTEEATRYLQELETSGVFSRTKDGIDGDGCIYSRRMVRDEANKKVWRENGRKGGNPKYKNPADSVDDLGNQNSNQNGQGGDNQNGRSSSSTSVKKSLSPARVRDGEERGEEPAASTSAQPPAIPDEVFSYAVNVLGWLTPDVLLASLLMDYPSDWVIAGMKILAEKPRRLRSPAYLRGVLQGFARNGGSPDDDDSRRNPSRTNAGAANRKPADFSDVESGARL